MHSIVVRTWGKPQGALGTMPSAQWCGVNFGSLPTSTPWSGREVCVASADSLRSLSGVSILLETRGPTVTQSHLWHQPCHSVVLLPYGIWDGRLASSLLPAGRALGRAEKGPLEWDKDTEGRVAGTKESSVCFKIVSRPEGPWPEQFHFGSLEALIFTGRPM